MRRKDKQKKRKVADNVLFLEQVGSGHYNANYWCFQALVRTVRSKASY